MMKANYKVRAAGNVGAVYYDGFSSGRIKVVLRFNTNIVESRYQLPIFRSLTQYLLEKEWRKINTVSKVVGISSNINCNGALSTYIDLKDKLTTGQAKLEEVIGLVLCAIIVFKSVG